MLCVVVLVGLPGSGERCDWSLGGAGRNRPCPACNSGRLLPSPPLAPPLLTPAACLPALSAGKSTLARVFEEAGWVVVNQDSLGDRKRCEAAAAAALAAGHSCVIDRCNHNAMQRRHWVDIARRHAQHTRTAVTLVALVLELPPELCLERACGRGDAHATLPASEAAAASERFKTEWQWPQRREGFDTVLAARSSEQATTLARALATQLPAAAQPAAAAVEPAVPAAPGGPGQAQQWRQVSSSRSDGDWRRPADGEGGQPPPSPQRSQHPGHGSLPASPARRGEGSSNAVPFPGRRQHGHMQQPHHPAHDNPHRPRRHPWSRHEYDEPSGVLLDNEPTAKPILLFDANGVLTSHTSMRRSTGLHLARPGTPHLRRLQASWGPGRTAAAVAGLWPASFAPGCLPVSLSCRAAPFCPLPPPAAQDHFHIGMFSSASQKTVDTALALLEEAAGPAPHRLFDRRFVLHRSHTFLAPLAHVARSGKEWDTVKPLKPYFSRLHRVILVDDDR